MKLSQDIIRQLIKEEISKSILNEASMQEAVESMQNSLSRMMGEMGYAKPDQLDPIYQQAKQNLEKTSSAANRKDIQEMGCGVDQAPMQSIDMGVDHHDDDHEGSMAKRQMFKTAQYAAEIFDNIQDGDEFPAWIQSKMTKIADYIGAVKHYLEYDHVMGEKLDKSATAGDYVKDFQDSDAPQFKGKSKKKKQQMAIAAYLDAKEDK